VRGYDPRVNAWQKTHDYINSPVGLAEAGLQSCPACGAPKRRRCTYTGNGARKGKPLCGRVHNARKKAVRESRVSLVAWWREHGSIIMNANLG
jgi:hypothetical protein